MLLEDAWWRPQWAGQLRQMCSRDQQGCSRVWPASAIRSNALTSWSRSEQCNTGVRSAWNALLFHDSNASLDQLTANLLAYWLFYTAAGSGGQSNGSVPFSHTFHFFRGIWTPSPWIVKRPLNNFIYSRNLRKCYSFIKHVASVVDVVQHWPLWTPKVPLTWVRVVHHATHATVINDEKWLPSRVSTSHLPFTCKMLYCFAKSLLYCSAGTTPLKRQISRNHLNRSDLSISKYHIFHYETCFFHSQTDIPVRCTNISPISFQNHFTKLNLGFFTIKYKFTWKKCGTLDPKAPVSSQKYHTFDQKEGPISHDWLTNNWNNLNFVDALVHILLASK